jgi:DNA polymerase-3 subunit delta'
MDKKIIGYEKIEQNLWQNFLNNKLHHCNLITGIKGNGKAEFIKNFAYKIIYHNQNITQTNHHPDILIIEAKSKTEKSIARILVDDVRNIKDFTNLSSSISKNKIIIINAIDDMNKNAFNALLKTIEEPKENIFIFLINHNIENIPDTIKSRSNVVRIPNFNFDNWSLIIKDNLVDITNKDLKKLHLISSNSISDSILLHNNNWLDIYIELLTLVTIGTEIEMIKFCEKLSNDKINFNIFIKIVDFLFLRFINLSYIRNMDIIISEENLIKNNFINMEKIFLNKDKISSFIKDIDIFNLEKKSAILKILLLIKSNLI